MTEKRTESILALDIGSENTRALLIELVDGQYKLTARRQAKTSIGAPRDDVSVAIGKLLRDVAATSERRFFDEDGHLIKPQRAANVGVDVCIASASAGPPVRAILLGLQPRISNEAGEQAAAPFYIEPVARVHLFDGQSDRARLNQMVDSRADLVIFSGGADGGAKGAMLNLLALLRQAVAAMTPGLRPVIVYAGNRDLAATARETLGQLAQVIIAPNIAPTEGSLRLEPLKLALARFYDEHRRRSQSFQHIADISDGGIAATAHGFERMTAFYARTLGVGVLGLDCGGSKSQLALARGDFVRSTLRQDIGLGRGAARLLEAAGESALSRWLPFQARKGELAQAAMKQGLSGVKASRDMRQRYIEYAFLRAAISLMLDGHRAQGGAAIETDLKSLGLVITAGAALTGSGIGALDLLLLADVMPLAGIVDVKCDRQALLPSLGALAALEPLAVVQLLEGGAVEHVGSLIRASGSLGTGKPALKLEIRVSSGEKIKREIVAGDVWHCPLASDESAEVRVSAARGIVIDGRRRLKTRLIGGRGGLLFDARLSALEECESMTERAIAMLRWFAAVTGDDQPVMIPESWLAPAD